MAAWIDQALWCLDRRQAAVLVSVAAVRGSAPREAGAKMLVSAGHQWLTIGGGPLEWVAMARARAMLQAAAGTDLAMDRHVFEVPLAASLGQCCGGLVHLLFERLREADRAWLEDARARLASLAAFEREVGLGGSGRPPWVRLQPPGAASRPADRFRAARLLDWHDARGCPVFTEPVSPDGQNVVVFGAGHVGRALVRILQTLPCRVTWVDAREDQFPDQVGRQVTIEATDVPEAVIDEAPAGSYFLIMTHDHALDQRLCEYLMRHHDFAYCGLIGSATKWHRFQQRFNAKGIPIERQQRITCPVGEPGITGKQPEVIAVAVAAQLLRLHARQAAASTQSPETLLQS
ncbi:xanthine dehydrogenase accessory protein XdhC [Castellaniella sp.]|uniref:xanthine dehydrogenase accessory protein XdhC n=1 Tax=Castellaniella sp. TaxID=1955812 RepID=UPI0035644E5E